MAGRVQRELEIVLLEIKIPSLKGKSHSTHILQSSLIWPRCGIAQKSNEKQLELMHGAVSLRSSGWCQKILFKEVVESLFGLEIKVDGCPEPKRIWQILPLRCRASTGYRRR